MKDSIKDFKTVIDSQLIKNIQSVGGQVFFVGGCVRDLYLNRKSKDIDIIVRCVPVNDLKDIMVKTGSFDLVGESFGVFIYNDKTGFQLDIAIPRKDSKGEGRGHKSIETQSDPFLNLEDDLKRRDFTFNAMALDMQMNLIDPFDGLRDLNAGLVRVVDEEAFPDDPLRIARLIRFAAVLNFDIEQSTLKLAVKHINDLEFIPGKRKKDELEKIIASGISTIALMSLLNKTNSTKQFLGSEFSDFTHDMPFETLDELLFLTGCTDTKFLFNFLTLTVGQLNRLNAFIHINKNFARLDEPKGQREVIFEALQIAKDDSILKSPLCKNLMQAELFIDGFLPTNKHQINLSGDEIMELGFKGKQIGDAQRAILDGLFSGELKNERDCLFKFVKENFKIQL